jgi:hypothetical protein
MQVRRIKLFYEPYSRRDRRSELLELSRSAALLSVLMFLSRGGEVVTSDLNEYAPLWGSEAKNYVLLTVEPDGPTPRRVILHRECRTGLVIEDDNIYRAVIQRMVEAGVEIVDALPR